MHNKWAQQIFKKRVHETVGCNWWGETEGTEWKADLIKIQHMHV